MTAGEGYDALTPAPPVPLDQVEWRVDGKPTDGRNGKVSRFVPYIDAAIVARLLDEWVGPARWIDEYHAGEVAGNRVLWCHLSIEVQPGVWITKRDVGKPSNFEAEKGNVSDAFKRAASLKWGAGRNVYDLPGDLWAPCRVYATRNGDAAAPTADTVPALLRQLKERGFDTTGVKVKDAPSEDRPEVPTDEPISDADGETRMALQEMFNGLTKELRDGVLERLKKAGTITRKSQGAIGTVAPEHFDTVRRTLEAAHKALAAGGGSSGGEQEEDGSTASAGTDPSPPTTADDGKPMLNQGTVADENGEAWSAEKLIAGIEQYRSQLSDTERLAWLAWQEEARISGPLTELDNDDLWAAYIAIADLAAGGDGSNGGHEPTKADG